jgi:plastocyanin
LPMRTTRFHLIASVSAALAFVAGVAAQTTVPATPPTTAPTSVPTSAPSSQPAGVSVRGHVAITPELALSSPDLTRVVVYLASDPVLDAASHLSDHATVAQHHKAFVPNFEVIPRNTPVEFPNWDDFDHNVFSRSKAAPAFDLDRYPRGQSKARTFDKVGIVQIFCNIHPSMRAIIFVTPNIYFARCQSDGHFTLTNVPPGKYEIVAWHERCGEMRQPVEVTDRGSPEIEFSISEDRKEIVANDPPKHDASYGVDRGLGVKREKLNLPVVTDAHAAIDPEK